MIGVIDYGAGNLQSVASALTKLEKAFFVAEKPKDLVRAERVILPGVGSAGSAVQNLLESGFIDVIAGLKVPFLGICLGLQLLADFSEEGGVQCLSIIPGRVKKFVSSTLKIPQIGWNKVELVKPSPLTKNIADEEYFYFVNSYYFDAPAENIIGKTLYGRPFPSIIQKNNFYGVQFHPEKSGECGLQLLRNFCDL
ncbi:MAG: imidazole glycerol phosphate synthase subunit HisH [Patescibacteria group bacterium]